LVVNHKFCVSREVDQPENRKCRGGSDQRRDETNAGGECEGDKDQEPQRNRRQERGAHAKHAAPQVSRYAELRQ
jgi:hypothetical protein